MTIQAQLDYFYALYALRSEGVIDASGLKYEDGKEWIGMWEDNDLPLRWETLHQQDDRIRDIFKGVIKDIMIQLHGE